MSGSTPANDSARQALEGPRRPIVALLENIRSAGNVGSMFRSADAVLLERILLCGYTAHPPHREIEKTALGATESVPWEVWGSSVEAIRWLQASGYTVLALETTLESQLLGTLQINGPVAFAVGNEATGLSPALLEASDIHVRLPMEGFKESLNVAVAFGVAAYTFASRTQPAHTAAAETG